MDEFSTVFPGDWLLHCLKQTSNKCMWMMISKTSDFRLVEQTLTLGKSVLPVCICVHVSLHAGVCTCKCVHGHLNMLVIFQLFIYVCINFPSD